MHPKSPANSRLGIHRAKILPRRGLFAAQTPRIMHDARILPFLGAPFERFDLFRVGWGGARVSRTVPVCAGWSGCFVGSLTCSFELLPAHAQDAPVVAPAFA